MLIVIFLLGAGGWFYYERSRRVVEEIAVPPPAIVLSEATTRILHSLGAHLEVRFFVPSKLEVLPPQLNSFAVRVQDLLAEYERVSNGKLLVVRVDPQMEPLAKNAASAAGIVPFANDAGDILYFGLTIGNGAQVESIKPLAPEWEPALESDLSRAIARLAVRPAAVLGVRETVGVQATTAIDIGVTEELLRKFPNLATQSVDDVTQVLRNETLESFKIAAVDGQAKLFAAQQNLATAQDNKSEAEIIAARQNLRRVQVEQTSKLNEIAGQLQARLAALQQLKTAPNLASPVR